MQQQDLKPRLLRPAAMALQLILRQNRKRETVSVIDFFHITAGNPDIRTKIGALVRQIESPRLFKLPGEFPVETAVDRPLPSHSLLMVSIGIIDRIT